MQLRGTVIEDTYSEAFTVWATRLVVTAADAHWRDTAVQTACGYGTSFIGCDAEVGRERNLPPDQTPDGRPGAALLLFARSADGLAAAVQNRAGQCLMTCPTTAVFDGLPDATSARFDLGTWLSYFGDGHQQRAERFGRAGWLIPVMEGEFFCEATAGSVKAVAGGTLFLGGDDPLATLTAARRAADAIAPLPEVITPFPGGVCRCGSKAGAHSDPHMIASTHEGYCPTLRDAVPTLLPEGVSCVYEIVIDGLSREAVVQAMRIGLDAAAGPGVRWISSGNYGGRLGKTHLPLREIAAGLPEFQS